MNDAMNNPLSRADPLRRYEATKGTRVGIVGIGGLGQMGVKLAKALGCTRTRTWNHPHRHIACDIPHRNWARRVMVLVLVLVALIVIAVV